MKSFIDPTVTLICLMLSTSVWGWTIFEVSPSSNPQQHPAVSGEVIVWQEDVEFEPGQRDWVIYGVDMDTDPDQLITVAVFEADQTRPAIWGTWVVWDDNSDGVQDIWLSDIRDPNDVQIYPVAVFELNQTFARVHGNTVVWQDQVPDPDTGIVDWNIFAADITDPAAPLVYPVAFYPGDQTRPDVYRSRIVWQDTFRDSIDIASADVWRRDVPDFFPVSFVQLEQTRPAAAGDYVIWQEGNGQDAVDIFGADVSDPDNPVEFLIAAANGSRSNPRLSGHLVVWQDNRDGAWDIYGYNLITRQTFAITSDTHNQTRPDIDGRLVVFEDDRDGVSRIYGVRLDGPEAAGCPTPVPGDLTGDCQVTMADLMELAANWLVDGLSD